MFAPLAIGVGVAFAWNGVTSLQAEQPGGMAGVAPQVTQTVQQAAARTWNSAVTTQAAGTRAHGRDGCRPRPSTSAPVRVARSRQSVATSHRHPRQIGTADIWCAVPSASRSE
jgi:hypothetical protein